MDVDVDVDGGGMMGLGRMMDGLSMNFYANGTWKRKGMDREWERGV
jgi:hypothetical protein